jgi:EmrB/QacA subfamily drug resistance transporter
VSHQAAGFDLDSRSKWKVLLSVVFGLFMILLDTTVVNVAFKTLQEEYAVNLNLTQWVLSIYTLALGIATPLAGYLGDRFGEKRVFLTGLAIFGLSSLMCGLAPNLLTLIIFRAVKGMAGGLSMPLGTSLLFKAFPAAERGKALGVFGIAMVAAPALGPILGGWLVDLGHWRWIFYLNVPIALLGTLLGSAWLPAVRGSAKTKMDPLGLFFSSVGFGSVLYAASHAAENGWSSPQVLLFFGIGAAALAAFAVVELFVAKEPLLDLRLFGNGPFLFSALTGWVSVLALFGAEFLLPLYLQVLRGKTALEAGIILLPLALASGVVAPFSGRLADRFGARPLAVIGYSLLAVNTWQFAHLTADTSIGWIQLLLALRGVALGLTVQITLLVSLSVVSLNQTARASSLVNATRQVVQSIGVAVLATILASSISASTTSAMNQFQSQAARFGGEAAAGQRVVLCGPGGLSATGKFGEMPLPPQALTPLRAFCSEYTQGFANTYMFTFYASLVAIALGATLPGWPGKIVRRQEAPSEVPVGH